MRTSEKREKVTTFPSNRLTGSKPNQNGLLESIDCKLHSVSSHNVIHGLTTAQRNSYVFLLVLQEPLRFWANLWSVLLKPKTVTLLLPEMNLLVSSNSGVVQLGCKLNKGLFCTFQRLENFLSLPISKLGAFIRRNGLIRIFFWGGGVVWFCQRQNLKPLALKRYNTVKQWPWYLFPTYCCKPRIIKPISLIKQKLCWYDIVTHHHRLLFSLQMQNSN